MSIDDLITLARNSGQLMAEDKASGVRILVRRGPHGVRVECYLNGERRHYNACKRAMEGAL